MSNGATTTRHRALRRLGGAAAALAASGAMARGRPVSGAEARAFRVANDLPDGAYPLVWAPMQGGTFGTVPALAAVAAIRGRRDLAVNLLAAGTAAWILAKGVKRIVRRGRPIALLDGVRLRGKEEGDLGFPSGHAAVSAAMATVAAPLVGPKGRRALAAGAALVAVTRWYVGAHLPLDSVGGAALGVVCGQAVVALRGN